MGWDPEMRLWRAVGDVSLVLMLHALAVEPLAKVWRASTGFGLSNLVGIISRTVGLIGLAWLLILAATSFDRAVTKLGVSGWKWLHTGAYVAFYLVEPPTAYVPFMHYKISFHRPIPPDSN